MNQIKSFDVQAISIDVAYDCVFDYVADPTQLPQWTNAFARAGNGAALLRTPNGEVKIDLAVEGSQARGTIDWRMTFPDGAIATAFSRVVPLGRERSLYCFVLTPPPVPLEQIEGALEEQSRTLREELQRLKRNLETHE